MHTGSELLGADSNRLVPLSATLVARPVRLCVFVPLHSDVPWEASVEHALACQTRYWGGHANLVVPMFDGLESDEMFWRLVRQYDPDMAGLHAPTLQDVEEFAPALHETAISRIRASLSKDGFEDDRIDEFIEQSQSELFWDVDLPDDLAGSLVRWVAPFHHGEQPRTVLVDGSGSAPYELLDVLNHQSLPPLIENVRLASSPVDQLLVTSSIGRLTEPTASALVERLARIAGRDLASLTEASGYLWPRDRRTCPATLAEAGLARRVSTSRVHTPLVVVGDEPRDWLLYHGLATLRPLVYWLPASRLAEGFFVDRLRHELRWAARNAGGQPVVTVLTAASVEPAEEAASVVLARTQGTLEQLQAHLGDWRDQIPLGAFWPADAPSVRTTALLRSAGMTEELATPAPVGFAPHDLLSGGWVVDVDVREWSTFRHSGLGPATLPGPFSSSHDQRIGVGGPSYFGLSGFVQAGLGLENALSRRQLAPRPVVDALAEVLGNEGWTVKLSDKGAFTQRSSELFGGVEELVTALRSETVRKLLDTYLADGRVATPGLFLSDTRRRYLSLGEAKELIPPAAEEVITSLYDRGVLTRGHVLKCDYCRAASFYSLSEDQFFTCRRCRHRQRATTVSWLGGAEPVFRYELVEVVHQFLDHDGDVPLLAAYDYFVSMLGARDRRPLDLGFEIEVISHDGKSSEHDIVAVWGSDLWLGEATKKTDLGPSEVARLRRMKVVSDLLAARGVLLATTGDFSTRTRERVASVFADWPRAEVAFLERLPLRSTDAEDL